MRPLTAKQQRLLDEAYAALEMRLLAQDPELVEALRIRELDNQAQASTGGAGAWLYDHVTAPALARWWKGGVIAEACSKAIERSQQVVILQETARPVVRLALAAAYVEA